jgi:hypothetical protein
MPLGTQIAPDLLTKTMDGFAIVPIAEGKVPFLAQLSPR